MDLRKILEELKEEKRLLDATIRKLEIVSRGPAQRPGEVGDGRRGGQGQGPHRSSAVKPRRPEVRLRTRGLVLAAASGRHLPPPQPRACRTRQP